jgi:amino acid adenylation domain-containing protein
MSATNHSFSSDSFSNEPKQALLKLMLEKKSIRFNAQTIPRRDELTSVPLSFAQERLWFLNQLEGSSATYNMPGAIRISGNLDINALQQALLEIVRRHEVLCTSFHTVNGTPRQVIHPQATMNINVVNLKQLEVTGRETVLQQQAQQEANIPFDLEVAPLIRCSLLQLDATEYVLLLTMHHIVSDSWSIGVFIKELFTLYQAFCAGEPSPLAALPIQYTDFAVWQRQWLSGEVIETQLNYWQQQLAGAPELLQLPTNRPRPRVQTYRGATQNFTLNTELTQKLQTFCVQSGTTLFMTLHAAFATLLYRYSGQSDILIGSPIANRNRSEIESLIGFFVNTLVLRTRLEDNPSFDSLLAQVREITLKAYEHQDVPFELVVEALQPERSLSHSPLFQVMFMLQNAPMGKLELPGVTLSELNQQSTIAKFDLTLSISETSQGLVGSWEYNTDLFDGSTIERMAVHFQNLLSAIEENPQQAVGELSLLSEAERHQLLTEWNDTESEYPLDKYIHQLFEEQVDRTPDAVAVVFDTKQLTYQQLNQRTNQLAHHLQSLGVRSEVLVGICVERSIEMVVGLLGILKAGGAYVPLDPSYPQERLGYMLADSGVEVLLTQQQLLSSLPSHTARVVCLDADWGAIEQHTQENLDLGVCSDNLAYAIYTSGSTGQPKGVQICHHSVVNFLNFMSHFPGLTQEDTFNAVTTISFDIAALEVYLPLAVGAKVIVAPREIATDADWLLSELFELKITVMQATPATWQMLLAGGWSSNYPLKVLCGGEALSAQLAHQILETGSELWNLYGPTEATIWSTIYQLGAKKTLARTEDAPSSIGRPIANTQIYILDSHLQPLPIGVSGELYIGGHGLARGYLNRPELTQEKFIQNPFSNSKSERLYKTGDLARYSSDGNIEFLGRIDNQVKVRGFRIELGEIEAVLNTQPQIQQAVVIATEDIAGIKRLVAYIVTRNESLTTHQLREFLLSKLPEYMVPSVFVTLNTLPLTPNGKIDRKALPAPDGNFPREHEYVAPRTQSEEIITNIFANVLGVQNVGIHDNFFEWGGHSLLAVRLMSQIQKQFQVNLPLATLFQSPTIEQLAVVLGSSSFRKLWSPLVPIQFLGSLPPFFCVAGAGGNVLYFHDLARYLGKDRPFYGLQAQGLDGETKPLESIEEIACQYIKAIETVQPVGPYFLGGHSFGSIVAFEMAQQLQRQGQSVAYVAILNTSAPISQVNHQDDFSNWDNAMWIRQIAGVVEELVGENLSISNEALASLTPEKQVNYFKQHLEMVGFLPPQADIKLVRGFLQVYQTQCQIDYLPHNTSPTPITLFRAQERNSQQENSSHLFQDRAWGWNQFSDGEVEIHTVPGSHVSMMSEPHVRVLAQKLQKSLEQAQTNQLEKSNAQTTL